MEMLTKRKFLKTIFGSACLSMALFNRPAAAIEKVFRSRRLTDAPFFPTAIPQQAYSFSVNASNSNDYFQVYTTDEIKKMLDAQNGMINGFEDTVNTHVSGLSTAVGAVQDQLVETKKAITANFAQTVKDTLNSQFAEGVEAKVRADLKADPDFRAEIKQELLDDDDFISQIVAKLLVAKLPPRP